MSTTRCPKHPDHPQSDCPKCREEVHQAKARAAFAANGPKPPCMKHGYPAADNCFGCRLEADAARVRDQAAIEKPFIKRPARVAEEEAAKAFLGIEQPVAPSKITEPRRKFFQPLPEGRLSSWRGRVDGMSPQNIAAFLMVPNFIYTDYEQNKNNPPVLVYVTADESINRAVHKLSENGGADHVETQEHSEQYTITAVSDEIQRRAEPIVIHVVGEPAKQIRRKIPPPPELVQALKDAEGLELERLTPKWNREHGDLTAKALATGRRAQDRKIAKLKKQKAAFDHVQLIDDPKTGRPAHDILIPPCPEGSHEIFPRSAIEKYVSDAYNTLDFTSWDDWRYAELENRVIQRMYDLNLFRGWPNERAYGEWMISGRPCFGSEDFRDDFGWFKSGKKRDVFEPDTTARDNSINGYRRSEGGYVEDDSIRRVGPGTVGGWHPAGHGPDSEERGDSYDHRWESDREKKRFGD